MVCIGKGQLDGVRRRGTAFGWRASARDGVWIACVGEGRLFDVMRWRDHMLMLYGEHRRDGFVMVSVGGTAC